MDLHSVKVNHSNMITHGTGVASIMSSKRPIAPAMDKNQSYLSANNNNVNHSSMMQNEGKYKRKYNYSGIPFGNQQTASVIRRNARERNRVKQVNNGFANLRQHIPPKVITQLTNGGRGANKKLSKVDTLRLAVEYIRSLQQLLDDNEAGPKLKASAESYYQTLRAADSPVSPTPSFVSETSTSGTMYSRQSAAKFKLEPYDQYDQSDSSSASYSPHETTFAENPFAQTAPSFKNESYEEYETINPEDEELLDTITWWQQQ